MMNKAVDARGLSCPQPVILAQKAIAQGSFPIEVIVDTVTASENVSRLAKKLGCQIEIIPQDDSVKLVIMK
jgi:tRNA 2-thiouridine synthesizing protein A